MNPLHRALVESLFPMPPFYMGVGETLCAVFSYRSVLPPIMQVLQRHRQC